MAANGGDYWPIWTTGSSATTWTAPVTITTTGTNLLPYSVAPSAGHIPAYSPPSLAEDEMAWLRRRITEVTDLFPVAA